MYAKNAIINTDVGYDPDDLSALLFAFSSPEIKVSLIVTNQDYNCSRAKLAKHAATLAGYDTEVVMGEPSSSMMSFFEESEFSEKVTTDYISSIDEVINKNSSTYYVSIGSLTEFANYLRHYESDSKKMSLIKNKVTLVQMGSSNRKPEFNFSADILSAKYVLSKGITSYFVTKEVTNNDSIKTGNESYFAKALRGSGSQLHKLLFKNLKYVPSFYLHDPLTLSSLINESIISFKKENIKFLDNGVQKYSFNPLSKTSISKVADYEKFKSIFFERVLLC